MRSMILGLMFAYMALFPPVLSGCGGGQSMEPGGQGPGSQGPGSQGPGSQGPGGQGPGPDPNRCVPGCESGFTCQRGTCVIDGSAVWSVGVLSATVTERNSNGLTWDPFGLPDPFVCLAVDAERRCTPARQDTLQPQWSQDLLMATARTLLDRGIRVSIYDEDVASHDIICNEGLLSITEGTLRMRELQAGCRVATVEITFRPR